MVVFLRGSAGTWITGLSGAIKSPQNRRVNGIVSMKALISGRAIKGMRNSEASPIGLASEFQAV